MARGGYDLLPKVCFGYARFSHVGMLLVHADVVRGLALGPSNSGPAPLALAQGQSLEIVEWLTP